MITIHSTKANPHPVGISQTEMSVICTSTTRAEHQSHHHIVNSSSRHLMVEGLIFPPSPMFISIIKVIAVASSPRSDRVAVCSLAILMSAKSSQDGTA